VKGDFKFKLEDPHLPSIFDDKNNHILKITEEYTELEMHEL